MQLSFLQKFLSHLYPVKIRKSSSIINPVLELFYYKGQWQLATHDALYSDGDRYRPMKLAFKKLKDKLPAVKSALILGTGLGSAVNILDKMGYRPAITLVEIDAKVIEWAREVLHLPRVKFVCEDANNFMMRNKEQFDLIAVDVFNSRVVPDFVTEQAFLDNCKKALSDNGSLILNYIITNKKDWENFSQKFIKTFHRTNIYELGMNRIFVAEN